MATNKFKSTVIVGIVVCLLVAGGGRAALIAQYEFEGNAENSVGREHGTLFGDAAIVIDPVMGSVLALDGDEDYVAFSDILIITEEFTLTAWANILGPGGGTKHSNPIFSQRDKTGSSLYDVSTVNMYAHAPNNSSMAGIDIRSSDGVIQNVYAPSMASGEWHHYAVTVSADTITFYIDGDMVASASNLQNGNYDTSIDFVSIGRHRFDKPGTGTVNGGLFNGMIDDVRIYDFAMTWGELNSMVIPEPASIVLIAAGGVLLRRRSLI